MLSSSNFDNRMKCHNEKKPGKVLVFSATAHCGWRLGVQTDHSESL